MTWAEKEILSTLNQRCQTGYKRRNHFVLDSTFDRLYRDGYIEGMGKDYETAIWCITDKGREYLKELEKTK